MKGCSYPNSGTVIRIHFKLGKLTRDDSKVQRL